MARDRVGKLIGDYKCWSCGEVVPVRKKNDDAGAGLSAPCTWCGFGHFAKRGTEHYDILSKQVRLKASQEGEASPAAPAADPGPGPGAASATAADPAPAPAPAAPPKRSFTTPLFGRN